MEWIEVKSIQNRAALLSAQRKYGLGPGELSAILLAKELGANPVLLDAPDQDAAQAVAGFSAAAFYFSHNQEVEVCKRARSRA
jgi:predicted nucleic acid-binding protein